MAATNSDVLSTPWYAAYPAPRTLKPASVQREDVLEMMKDCEAGKDFVLVDLRRNDHDGGTIRGSLNLPAQSLFPMIPTLHKLFKAAGLKKIIWYCSSSRGRGNRAAGWFADYIADQGDTDMASLVLFEGIAGWATAGAEYVRCMDEYDEKAWS